MEDHFELMQYEDPTKSALTHSLFEFDVYSPIEKERSNLVFYLNSRKVANDSDVNQVMWTEHFEKLPSNNSLVMTSTFKAP